MISRREFVVCALGLAGIGCCLASVVSFDDIDTQEDTSVSIRHIDLDVVIAEDSVIDVPPTEDNLRTYTQVVEYWGYGIKPYEDYVPPCSMREASAALERMVEWTPCVASAYDVESNYGTETASGIPLNDFDVTVAHKTLPLGTIVNIWWEGRCITATVTDRGPYIDGRDFDLAAGACLALSGMNPMDWGVREIWYRIVRYPE